METREAGEAMHAAAELVLPQKEHEERLRAAWNMSREDALAHLDQICHPWQGTDVGFTIEIENHPRDVRDPNQPLGTLIDRALGDAWAYEPEQDMGGRGWHESILPRFAARYQLM